MQVDWVGVTGEVIDPDAGEVLKVYVFAACLPYSNCLYTEGFYKTDEESWVNAHVHMFAFFGGATPILVLDVFVNRKPCIAKGFPKNMLLGSFSTLAGWGVHLPLSL